MRNVEFAVVAEDIRWVEADLIVLKHAAAFLGAEATVARAILQCSDLSLEQIANQIDTEGYFVAQTQQSVQAPTVLFVKVPGLEQLHYRQIYNFAGCALAIAAKCIPNATHIAMTIHGPGSGLEVSVAFLAQLSGLITALAADKFPSNLQGISFVEQDRERAALLTLLLRYRLAGEVYARSSVTGAIQLVDVQQIQQATTIASQ
jgi:hypothetical protein